MRDEEVQHDLQILAGSGTIGQVRKGRLFRLAGKKTSSPVYRLAAHQFIRAKGQPDREQGII